MTKAEFTRDEVIDFIVAFDLLRVDERGLLCSSSYAYDESIAPKWLIDGLIKKLKQDELLNSLHELLSQHNGPEVIAALTAAMEKYAK